MSNQSSYPVVSDEIIMKQIYYIRDQKVMLDEDLAELYQVTTGNLNKAVARNIKRFPPDFMFRLTDEEFKNLLFQNGISSWGGRRQAPNAFTEEVWQCFRGTVKRPGHSGKYPDHADIYPNP